MFTWLASLPGRAHRFHADAGYAAAAELTKGVLSSPGKVRLSTPRTSVGVGYNAGKHAPARGHVTTTLVAVTHDRYCQMPNVAFNATEADVNAATLLNQQNENALLLLPSILPDFFDSYPSCCLLVNDCLREARTCLQLGDHLVAKCLLVQYFRRAQATIFTWHIDQDDMLTTSDLSAPRSWPQHEAGPNVGQPVHAEVTVVCNLCTTSTSMRVAGAENDTPYEPVQGSCIMFPSKAMHRSCVLPAPAADVDVWKLTVIIGLQQVAEPEPDVGSQSHAGKP